MKVINFLRDLKWSAVAALFIAGSAVYAASQGASDITVALSALAITFAILAEKS